MTSYNFNQAWADGNLTDAEIIARDKAKGRIPSGTGGNGGSGGGGHAPPSPGLPASDGSAVGAAIDVFSTGSNYVDRGQPAGQNFMTSYYIKPYNAMRVDLYFNDLSGGIDAQIRQLSDGIFTNELAASYLNATHSRTLILPPLVTSDAGATNSVGTLEAMSACYLNDGGTPRWLVAAGDTADKCLFALTTSVTKQTYTPSSNIISLTATPIVTATERVIVGRAGAAAQVLTGFNGTPTTSGTMHANTTGLWGVISTPFNTAHPGKPGLLMYCNGGLYYLSTGTSAIGDAPTAIYTTWNKGGYALGRCTLWNDGVERAYWVHPLNDSSTSMLDSGAPGKIVSTNLEGTDYKELIIPGLQFIKHALIWRGGIVATDGRSVVWINADATVNLGWNRERRWEKRSSSSGTFGFGVIQALAVAGSRLLVSSATITAATGDYASPSVWEEYVLSEDKWQFFVNVAPGGDLNTTAGLESLLPNVSLFTGQTPVYSPFDTGVDNGLFYWYAKITNGAGGYTFEWQNCPLLPPIVNPMYQQAEAAYITYQFDPRRNRFNYAITPEYHIYPAPMVVSDIQYKGRIRGEDAAVWIEVGTMTASGIDFVNYDVADGGMIARFVEDTDWRKNWWINPNPRASMMDRLQLMIAVLQGSSGSHVSKSTPNALPFRVGLYFYLDGMYKDPKVMEPDRYWGDLQ